MFVLLIEFYAMIQVSISLQTHRTVVAYFVPGNFGLFRRNPPGSHSRHPKVPWNPGSHGMDGTVTSWYSMGQKKDCHADKTGNI